jgi:hypothetical protein
MRNSVLTGRFGVEIELNSPDLRDFVKNPLKSGEYPSGMDRIASIVSKLGFDCQLHEWRYNHNSSCWCCKPDRSCGIELCSPVLDKESKHQLFLVMDALSDDPSVLIDERCSFHVHIELSSMDFNESAASILAWWVKCEHVFFDFAAPFRKNNFYCRPIGTSDLFAPDETVHFEKIFSKLRHKHFSANAFHLFNRRRKTLEFRLAEGTRDSFFADMWIKTIFSFAKAAESRGLPSDYLWMTPLEVLEFMNMDSSIEEWFLSRLISNCLFGNSECFSPYNRKHALEAYLSRRRENSHHTNVVMREP